MVSIVVLKLCERAFVELQSGVEQQTAQRKLIDNFER